MQIGKDLHRRVITFLLRIGHLVKLMLDVEHHGIDALEC